MQSMFFESHSLSFSQFNPSMMIAYAGEFQAIAYFLVIGRLTTSMNLILLGKNFLTKYAVEIVDVTIDNVDSHCLFYLPLQSWT